MKAIGAKIKWNIDLKQRTVKNKYEVIKFPHTYVSNRYKYMILTSTYHLLVVVEKR